MHAYIHTYVRTYIHAYIHTYIHTSVYTCIRAYAISANVFSTGTRAVWIPWLSWWLLHVLRYCFTCLRMCFLSYIYMYIYIYVEAHIVDAFACQSFLKVVIDVIRFLFEPPSSPCLKCRVETGIYKANHKNHKYCNHAIYVFPQQQLVAAYDIAFWKIRATMFVLKVTIHGSYCAWWYCTVFAKYTW